jgi:peptidoglycan/xylan/chitin deacetylase (PgdA/CDA1 family)/cyclopropane fatty-acyl-phospholipid synthase-like methyltransferase
VVPLISFIIPAHNAVETLRVTLESLRAQSLADWEAIVVDDGSTDGTGALAEEIAHEDRRITCKHISNGGVCRARNDGLRAASADWVVFLDADDWVDPSYVKSMMAAADTKTDLIYCGYRRITADGHTVLDSFTTRLESAGFELLARECVLAVHCVVVRRALICSLDGFDPALKCCEDWDLWQRAARCGARIRAVPKILAMYRMGVGTLSGDLHQMLVDGLTVLGRGYGPDPRVTNPSPAFANGAADNNWAERATHLAIWCAAADVGSGNNGTPLLDLIPRSALTSVDGAILANTIVEGLAIGARVSKEELASRYSVFSARLYDLIAALSAEHTRSGAAQGLLFQVERAILECHAGETCLTLSQTAACRIDLRRIENLRVAQGIERSLLILTSGDRRLNSICVAALDSISAKTIAELAVDKIRLARFLYFSQSLLKPSFWISATASMLTVTGRFLLDVARFRSIVLTRVVAKLKMEIRKASIRTVTVGAAKASLVPTFEKRAQSNRQVQEEISISQQQKQAPKEGVFIWDDVFASVDPWGYSSSEYEQKKYELTLSLLPDEGTKKALELACAEGAFTTKLASRVTSLIAADISRKALDRARAKCLGHDNIEFSKIDLAKDELPGGQDLIICSEVLYYLDGRRELKRVARKIRDALAPGGRLITANHMLLKDDMSATGFDWDQQYGGKVIHEVFAATPGFELERSLVTELYRIDRFRATETKSIVPQIQQVPIDHLEDRVAHYVVWGGAIARRREVESERTWRIPILAYHRIAEDGPEALSRWRVDPGAFRNQLRLLRSHGFHAVSSEDVQAHYVSQNPFPGRPVLITFDDGYRDFADVAWPILFAHDFLAEVFLVSDLVGDAAIWDAGYGEPAALMDWPTIERLHNEGVRFGSHLASHTPAPNLRAANLFDEADRSRRILESRLKSSVFSIAAPYGDIDDSLRYAAAVSGYTIGFASDGGIADLRDKWRYDTPRIEVGGDWDLLRFARALQLPT